jgi:hypothetical protein
MSEHTKTPDEQYEPPAAKEIDTNDGPAVTAADAGGSPPADQPVP